MKDNTPRLDQLRSRGDGYKRPGPDFFRELAARVEQEAQAAPVAKRRRLWPQLSAAAAALLLLLWWQLGPTATNDSELIAEVSSFESLLDELSDDDILAYIEENVVDFEEELIESETEEGEW